MFKVCAYLLLYAHAKQKSTSSNVGLPNNSADPCSQVLPLILECVQDALGPASAVVYFVPLLWWCTCDTLSILVLGYMVACLLPQNWTEAAKFAFLTSEGWEWATTIVM